MPQVAAKANTAIHEVGINGTLILKQLQGRLKNTF